MPMQSPITSTKYTWLSPEQRSTFRDKWDYVRDMMNKWFWPGNTELFTGKKDLEQEIKDLEDLSLAAYRAMKLLRKHLEDANAHYENENYFG